MRSLCAADRTTNSRPKDNLSGPGGRTRIPASALISTPILGAADSQIIYSSTSRLARPPGPSAPSAGRAPSRPSSPST
jgi:hypothetical protein